MNLKERIIQAWKDAPGGKSEYEILAVARETLRVIENLDRCCSCDEDDPECLINQIEALKGELDG